MTDLKQKRSRILWFIGIYCLSFIIVTSVCYALRYLVMLSVTPS